MDVSSKPHTPVTILPIKETTVPQMNRRLSSPSSHFGEEKKELSCYPIKDNINSFKTKHSYTEDITMCS